MKRTIKVLFSSVMIVSLLIMTSSVSFAADKTSDRQKLVEISGDLGTGYFSEAPDSSLKQPGSTIVNKLETVEELLEAGLSFEEASTLIDIQEITEKMKSSGQKLDVNNGRTYVTEASEDKESISQEDIQRITQLADAQLKKPVIDNKDKIAKVNDLMAKNPQRSYFREEFADGSWIEVNIDEKRDTPIKSDEVKTYARVEVDNIDIYGQNGSYTKNFVWRQFDPTRFCEMNLQYTYNVANSNHIVKLTGINQILNFSGIFELDNEDTAIEVDETNYDESPTIWCQGYSSIRWHLDLSTSVTLGGIFTINIPAHGYWTQLQEVDISLVNRHHYASY